MMGLFGGNNELIENRLKQCVLLLDNLEGDLLSIHLSFLEKERYMMGLNSAEDYKKILEKMTSSKWNRLESYIKSHNVDSDLKEEVCNEQ